MSAIFKNLTSDNLEQSQDRLGGGFQPLNTDIYTGIIRVAYASQSAKGAHAVNLIINFGDREYRETIYITNAKGENWFVSKQDKKVPLPGFTTIDDLCLCAAGIPLSEMEAEEKVIKVYDNESKTEIPKAVPMLTELLGKEISVAIYRTLVNKNEKNEATGEYVATAEEREENSIEKVFNTETKMTVVEARNGAKEAVFWDAWVEKHKGEVRDRREIKDGQPAGAPAKSTKASPFARPTANAAAPAAAAAPARKSLFGAR